MNDSDPIQEKIERGLKIGKDGRMEWRERERAESVAKSTRFRVLELGLSPFHWTPEGTCW